MLVSDHIQLNKYTTVDNGSYEIVSTNIARIAAQTTELLRARGEGMLSEVLIL